MEFVFIWKRNMFEDGGWENFIVFGYKVVGMGCWGMMFCWKVGLFFGE